ncbi:MAG: hypothetical protein AB7S38_28820 [Vulcanimicrobiota bacterium]
MATRGIIARRVGDGWHGVYHHSDSYPTGLGRTLWRFYHGISRTRPTLGERLGLTAPPDQPTFSSLEEMLRFVIDEHPWGWSNLAAVAPSKPPKDYSGPPEPYTDRDPVYNLWWVYVLDPTSLTMTVVDRLRNGSLTIGLDGPEPNWDEVLS